MALDFFFGPRFDADSKFPSSPLSESDSKNMKKQILKRLPYAGRLRLSLNGKSRTIWWEPLLHYGWYYFHTLSHFIQYSNINDWEQISPTDSMYNRQEENEEVWKKQTR